MTEPTPYRDLKYCPYRTDVSTSDGHEWAVCQLVAAIAGIQDRTDLCKVRQDACTHCCRSELPTSTRINSMVGSILFSLIQTLIKEGNAATLGGEKRIRELEAFAFETLEIGSAATPSARRAPKYVGPCFHLGESRGVRSCPTCRGNVRVKVFECLHENYEETSIRECQSCCDYDQKLARASVSDWAVALTTAPRKTPTLARTVKSLAAAGWPDPHVFSEPETTIPKEISGLKITRRKQRMGAWGNWLLALNELYLGDPNADAYFLCQDDVVYPKGLRNYLEETLWPSDRVGVVSLHTPSHHAHDRVQGYFQEEVGWGAWGAMGFVFPNAAVRALLRDSRVVDHRFRGIGEGMQNVDSVVGDWCKRRRVPFFLHSPSLSQHIGEKSTLWEKATLGGRRSASDFPGEERDVRDVMIEIRLSNDPKDTLEAREIAPDTAQVIPRESGLAAVVIPDDTNSAVDPSLTTSIDAQELPPDEKILISLGEVKQLANGWQSVPPAGTGFEGALRGALQATRSSWLVIFRSGDSLTVDFFADLNAGIQTVDSSCGSIVAPSAKAEDSQTPGPPAHRRDVLQDLLNRGAFPVVSGPGNPALSLRERNSL